MPSLVVQGAWPGMVTVEAIGQIRRAFWVDKKSTRLIVRELRISRQTVRQAMRSASTEFRYARSAAAAIGGLCRTTRRDDGGEQQAAGARAADGASAVGAVVGRGFDGACDSVERHVRERRRQQSQDGTVFEPARFSDVLPKCTATASKRLTINDDFLL